MTNTNAVRASGGRASRLIDTNAVRASGGYASKLININVVRAVGSCASRLIDTNAVRAIKGFDNLRNKQNVRSLIITVPIFKGRSVQ